MVERLKNTIMAKRRNKTYEQQKKFYDGSNNYESLGALFFLLAYMWKHDSREDAGSIQRRHKGMQGVHN